MESFAKSIPLEDPQTILAHTADVVNCAYELKRHYRDINCTKKFWEALILACKVHDLGKYHVNFQYRICKNINKSREKISMNPLEIQKHKISSKKFIEIPHNILSPAFLCNFIDDFSDEQMDSIYQAVAFHHRTETELVRDRQEWIQVCNVINNDLGKNNQMLDDLSELFSDKIRLHTNYQSILKNQNRSDFYIMLKGLLHRADHAASAAVPVEITSKSYTNESVQSYLMAKGIPEESIWQKKLAVKSTDENVILQAGTGSGKTEFALFWLDGKKGFYTLPLRTSVNAMYDRLCSIYEKQQKDEMVGLLHSDSIFYLMDKSDGKRLESDDMISDPYKVLDESRQLSMPVSVSTADQLFTATFHYLGYEKIYATLACSKLIIDEIQAYGPEITAVLLKGLVEMNCLGCKFCIITATLPPFYLEYLEKKGISYKNLPPRFKDQPRHKISMLDHGMQDLRIVDLIRQRSSDSDKILVIVNTVKAAIAVKTMLDKAEIECQLLHSRFTLEDRRKKETAIKDNNLKGVWITTQLVEASVDIDFDVLVTEMSTIDSQIQRWGRIWRRQEERKKYDNKLPNIYITSDSSDNGKIYDPEITLLTKNRLEKSQDHILTDCDEFEMIQDVFKTENIKDTEYMKKFKKSMKLLDEMNYTIDNKRQAQKLFRDIDGIAVIPGVVYEKNKSLIDSAILDLKKSGTDKKVMRYEALKTIKEKSVSVRRRYYDENMPNAKSLDRKYQIRLLDVPYSYDMGMQLQ